MYGECGLVVFVVALDECFVSWEEGKEVNGLLESLRLWKEVTSNEKLEGVPFVLVLNKRDVFFRKIKRKTQHLPFPDMDPVRTYDREYCINYVIDRFRDNFKGCLMLEFVMCAMEQEEVSNLLKVLARNF